MFKILFVIGLLTVVSGLTQMVFPGTVLSFMTAGSTPLARHSFGIVGMFMVFFGGALMHALLHRQHQPVVVLWASVQKSGAACAVSLGVIYGIFEPLALCVALFDACSGVIGLMYWRTILTPLPEQ